MTSASAYIIDATPFSRNGNLHPNNLDAVKNHLVSKITTSIPEQGQSGASIITIHERASLLTPLMQNPILLKQSVFKISPAQQLFWKHKFLLSEQLKTAIDIGLLALKNHTEVQQSINLVLYISSPIESEFEMAEIPADVSIKVFNIGTVEMVNRNRELLQKILPKAVIQDVTSGDIVEQGVKTGQYEEYEDDPELQQALLQSMMQQHAPGNPGNQGQDFGDLM